ncbi:MAG: peptidylprolyl isomerase [Acidocella sp. 20-57-95]|nr:MAG: peptidylprolyl isomerase [Acidocella sp. 20-57-95]OYV58114.1 MAG: peptidylprolyl isomerase [Acidocella sp. 21-58-7]HQT64031.1 peptidylprolyl isomerase [Acidocella sp.]
MNIVTVNNVPIARATLIREVQNHAAASPAEAWSAATRALVIRELLLQRANELGLIAVPIEQDGARETGEEALIRTVLECEVHTPKADDATCRRYYDSHPSRFLTPDLFEPAHILFKARQDDEAAFALAIAQAQAVLVELTAHPDRFERLARSLSVCPSATEGGRLGQIVLGETSPEFEAVLVNMQENQILATPVPTRYGVHILRLDRKISGVTLPFEAVRDRIASYLEVRTWRRAVAQYIFLLAGQAQIVGFDLPGSSSPLVQ